MALNSPHATEGGSRSSDDLACAGREPEADRLLKHYLVTAEAANRALQELPTASAGTFADRADALAWLDAERLSLVGSIRMASDTGRDEAALRLPLLMSYYLGFRGKFDELLAVTMISLQTARRLDDRTAESEALTNLGLAYAGLGRNHEAATAHRTAVGLFRESNNVPGEGDALNNLGLALHALGDDAEAARAHESAVTIFGDNGAAFSEARALNNLGIARSAQGRHSDAVTAHQRAVEVFRSTGHKYEEARTLGNLGNAYYRLGVPDQAAAAYRQAGERFHETGDFQDELMVRQNLELTRQP